MKNHLTQLCRETFGGDRTISDLKRLTGGASAATWSFDYGQTPLVLRQKATDPTELIGMEELQSVSLKTEAELISRAGRNGIKAPNIHTVIMSEKPLGEAVLMERVGGEALPQKLFKDPKYKKALSTLLQDCAETLAKIHDIPFKGLERDLETRSPQQALSNLKLQFDSFGQNSPVLASALHWMSKNCPEADITVLVHGDFRMGNLLVDEGGLTAVLDWELSHIGDPISDISFFCAPPWRFGRYERQAGGIGSINNLIASYEKASGRKINPARLLWWRMHASVNWCLICMIMGNMWRSGADRELERIVIGTRVSESEIDLLLLFDEIYGFEDKLDLSGLTTEPENNKAETKPEELAEAISEWLSQDIIPNAAGRNSFKARVARNAVGILRRNSQLALLFSDKKNARLSNLKLTAGNLCKKLLNGNLDIQSDQIRFHLKQSTLEQITIDQPKYAGLHVAIANWSKS